MSYDYARQKHRCNGCGCDLNKTIVDNLPLTRVLRYGVGSTSKHAPNLFHFANAGEFCATCSEYLMDLIMDFCRSSGGFIPPQQPPTEGTKR